MKSLTFDLEYLCNKMTDMSGLPIRIYEKNILKSRYSVADFVVDPVIIHLEALLNRNEHVSYYITELYDYYGVIKSDDTTIIIGPGRNEMINDRQLHDMAFELNITNKDFEAFATFMRSIMPMPLDSMIQMMCTINHILNGEKLNVSDFHLRETSITQKMDFEMPSSDADIYKGYNVEKQILDIIRSGDTEYLEQWVRQAPTVRGGKMSDNLLRQKKNTFIISTTLAARTVIDCGIDVTEAFRLSDYFIQKCENCSYADDLNYLQYEMIMTYTRQVGALRKLTSSRISKDVYNYVIQHISDSIRTEDVADALYMSRSHLSTAFKKETGINLNDYIHQIKIERARELLQDTSKSVTLISDYLGYSSSSHFNRVFRQIMKMTPKEYRKTL